MPPASEVLFLQAPIAPLLVEDERALLVWNLNGRETNGCTLALDGEARLIVLCFQEHAEGLDDERLAALLKRFMQTAEQLRGRLLELGQAMDAPARRPAASPVPLPMQMPHQLA